MKFRVKMNDSIDHPMNSLGAKLIQDEFPGEDNVVLVVLFQDQFQQQTQRSNKLTGIYITFINDSKVSY